MRIICSLYGLSKLHKLAKLHINSLISIYITIMIGNIMEEIQYPRRISSDGKFIFGGKLFYCKEKDDICQVIVHIKTGLRDALIKLQERESQLDLFSDELSKRIRMV